MLLTIRGARLVDAAGEQPDSTIVIEGTRIVAVGPDAAPRGTVIDAADVLVTPGFVDVHTHGGGGFNLHATEADAILAYAEWAATTGTTAFLVGVVGVPDGLPEDQLRAAVTAIDIRGRGAEPVGIHLEGPYLNVRRRGAHHLTWLRTPEVSEVERMLGLAAGHLRLITLAPELPGAAESIRRLVEAGVTVSIGHTDASYEQAQEAIRLGISHATHCFNAMPPLLPRSPGPLGAIIEASQVRGELIADGVHVHPASMRALTRALGPSRTVAITDALAAAGLANATVELGGQPTTVADGVARLADGTIAGSILTMDQALRNVLAFTGVSLPEAVGMLTHNPAGAAGVADRKGRLQPGYDADLLILDEGLTLQATLCRGKPAFATDSWRRRLPA